MKAFKFHTIIGEDRVIRVPQGIEPLPREAEVILLQKEEPARQPEPTSGNQASKWPLVKSLAEAAEGLGADDLPTDLAENHDHYLYGSPKSIEPQ